MKLFRRETAKRESSTISFSIKTLGHTWEEWRECFQFDIDPSVYQSLCASDFDKNQTLIRNQTYDFLFLPVKDVLSEGVSPTLTVIRKAVIKKYTAKSINKLKAEILFLILKSYGGKVLKNLGFKELIILHPPIKTDEGQLVNLLGLINDRGEISIVGGRAYEHEKISKDSILVIFDI